MWILLIVLFSHHGLTSEQMFFDTLSQCEKTKELIESTYTSSFTRYEDAKCVCVPMDH